jgi:hypothetical protein
MKELLAKILTDTSARSSSDLSVLASSLADEYLPWGGSE